MMKYICLINKTSPAMIPQYKIFLWHFYLVYLAGQSLLFWPRAFKLILFMFKIAFYIIQLIKMQRGPAKAFEKPLPYAGQEQSHSPFLYFFLPLCFPFGY